MGAERGGLVLNRAASRMTVLAVGCRHVEDDWFEASLDWGRRPQIMSHGHLMDSSQPGGSQGPSVNGCAKHRRITFALTGSCGAMTACRR